VSARVRYSGGGGGMGSKAYTISKGSIAYQAPGSSYLHENNTFESDTQVSLHSLQVTQNPDTALLRQVR